MKQCVIANDLIGGSQPTPGDGLLLQNPQKATGLWFGVPTDFGTTPPATEGVGLRLIDPQGVSGLILGTPDLSIVVVDPPIPVQPPTINSVIPIGSTSLQVTFTDNQTIGSDSFNIYVMEVDVGELSGSPFNTTDNPYYIGSLTAETMYSIQMTALVGAEVSGLSNARTVTTPAVSAFVPIYNKTFEGGTPGALAIGSDAFTGQSNPGYVTYSSTQSKTGTQSARFFQEGGNTNDQGASVFISPIIGKGQVWVKCDAYFPSGYSFVSNTEGQKFMRLNVIRNNAWDFYIGSSGMYIACGISDGNIMSEFYSESNTFCPYDGNPIRTCREIGSANTTGVWHTYEMYINQTEVANDGIIRAWQDGILVYEAVGLKTIPSASDGLNRLEIFSGPQPNPSGYPQDQYCYVDNIVITDDSSLPPNLDADNNLFIGAWV